MSITLVTCIYNSDYISGEPCIDPKDDPANGPMRWQRFYRSLANISNTQVPVVIYTNPGNLDYLENFCSKNFAHSKYKIVVFDITVFHFFERTEKLKEHNLAINKKENRYAQLVLSKMFMMEHAMANNFFNTERYFWIDAGLSFQSLFPDRWCPDRSGGRTSEYFKYTCFNPGLITKLERFSDEKLFVIVNNSGHGLYLTNEGIYDPPERVVDANKYYTIGGLWGGKKEQLQKMVDLYKVKLFKAIAAWEERKETTHRSLFFEEPIFSAIVCSNPEDFYIERFDTWYQENDHSQVKNILPGMRSFYKIITGEP